MTLTLGKFNTRTHIQMKLYCVELLEKDHEGKEERRHIIKAFGIDAISKELPAITTEGIKMEFSKEPQEAWNLMDRPSGHVDLLIGSEEAHLHPVMFETR